MEEVKVGIISGDGEFVDCITQSWRRLGFAPLFTVAAEASGNELAGHAVVLTDGVQNLRALHEDVVLAIALPAAAADVQLAELQDRDLRVMYIARSGAWADQAALLAQQTVLRLEAQAQLAKMRQRLQEAERYAALGRFIVESRHAIGNALTGVLGHSELLLLEGEEQLRGQARAQVEMIRQMSLKMHETFHRLSSLDMELRRQAERDAGGTANVI